MYKSKESLSSMEYTKRKRNKHKKTRTQKYTEKVFVRQSSSANRKPNDKIPFRKWAFYCFKAYNMRLLNHANNRDKASQKGLFCTVAARWSPKFT